MPRFAPLLAASVSVGAAAAASVCNASYAIYVGKNLTADGSVLIGGSGDEVSSHWLDYQMVRCDQGVAK